jgi:N utilization substance protein B
MLSRNQSQEKMMSSIYIYLFNQKNNNELDVKDALEGAFEMSYEDIDIYSKEVVVKSLLNQEEIDKLISDNLSEKLKLSRINIVAHAILLLAIGQYKYVNEIQKGEMINVAVELAKKYLDDGEYKFVNAILDKVL